MIISLTLEASHDTHSAIHGRNGSRTEKAYIQDLCAPTLS